MKFESEEAKAAFREAVIKKLLESGEAIYTGKKKQMLLGIRVPYEIPSYFGQGLPGSKERKQEPKNKFTRHRHKMRDQGLCEVCGKPAYPFARCQKHLAIKRLSNTLGRMVKEGTVERVSVGVFKLPGAKTACKLRDFPA